MSRDEITEEKAKKLWSRLFGEEDHAELKDLSDDEFEKLTKILGRLKIGIDWEGNKATRTIYLWRPKTTGNPMADLVALSEYADFLFLISMLKGGHARKKYLGKT